MRYSRDGAEFNRAIAFFDATYAVALTLLVTTLDIPNKPLSFRSVSALYDAVGAQIIAFAIAFVVIAGYWLSNHRKVASFVAIDTPTIVAHLCLLAAIVFLPFTTASVGDPDVAGLPLPTVLMAIGIAAVSLLDTLVWVVAHRGDLLDHTPTSGEWRESVITGLTPTAVFIVSVPIAYLVSPGTARLSWLLLLVVNPVVGVWMARARRRSETK